MRRPNRFVRYILPILLYAGAIFIASSQSDLPQTPEFPAFDKLVHFGEYAVLAWLVGRALHGYGMAAARAVGLTILVCTFYGVTDELHQRYTPNRLPSVMDLLADFVGASAGAGTWYAVLRRRNAERKHPDEESVP